MQEKRAAVVIVVVVSDEKCSTSNKSHITPTKRTGGNTANQDRRTHRVKHLHSLFDTVAGSFVESQ
jgi:hypothetical protein